ncbi:MAG: transcription factor S [Candidatus Aenigmarchaeota archaeon]|nr:transcription factor S [Candidatus Aenigmarchaeota archaeon]
MKFCDKCGNLMNVKTEFSAKFLYCRSCGNKTRLNEKLELSDTRKIEKKEVIVVEDEKEEFPVTQILCPKCGVIRDAYWTMQQTRGGDEPPTRFYQCKECSWRWREYS